MYLVGTILATISTGEHYVIDLIPGLALACLAASLGSWKLRNALLYLGVVLSWSCSVRFGYFFLIAHSWLLRSFAALTLALVIYALVKEWRAPAISTVDPAVIPQK